jgi:hypothetical protein
MDVLAAQLGGHLDVSRNYGAKPDPQGKQVLA